MSDPVSRRPSATEPAVGETPSAGPLPAEAQDAGASHSPIEREIERSERASAALAATRALARAAFTDSQLAAEDAVAAEDADVAAGWVRTEYAEFDHSVPADEDAAFDRPPPAGASFDPGIASQQGRVFPGAALADASLRTRTGAQARFRQDSRHASRDERSGGPAARHELAPGGVGHDRLAVTALPASASSARPDARQPRAAASGRSQGRGGARFLLAAGLGGVIVLAAGGAAWKAGLLSRNAGPGSTAAPAQVEAARGLAPALKEISVAPAAGALPPRSEAAADVAAQAAEARAAAVPTDAVHEPEPVPVSVSVSTPAVHPQATASTTMGAPAPLPHRKVDVAAAIANAQAKAERFLAPVSGAASTPSAGEGRQAP